MDALIPSKLGNLIQYAIQAHFRDSVLAPFQKGVLLRLADDFEPDKSLRSIDEEEIAPGVTINFYGSEIEFQFLCYNPKTVSYLDTGTKKYLELGWDDVSRLATISFLALPNENMDVIYEAMIIAISGLLPIRPR